MLYNRSAFEMLCKERQFGSSPALKVQSAQKIAALEAEGAPEEAIAEAREREQTAARARATLEEAEAIAARLAAADEEGAEALPAAERASLEARAPELFSTM